MPISYGCFAETFVAEKVKKNVKNAKWPTLGKKNAYAVLVYLD